MQVEGAGATQIPAATPHNKAPVAEEIVGEEMEVEGEFLPDFYIEEMEKRTMPQAVQAGAGAEQEEVLLMEQEQVEVEVELMVFPVMQQGIPVIPEILLTLLPKIAFQ